MITWKNASDELAARLQTESGTTIFVSYDQVIRIWGLSGFRRWCSRNHIHPTETDKGYTLQHRPKTQ